MRRFITALGLGLGAGLVIALIATQAEGPTAKPGHARSPTPASQPLEDPESLAEPRAPLGRPAGLALRVVRGGAPLPGATVSLYRWAESRFVAMGTEVTADDGAAHFPARAGRHVARAIAPDTSATALAVVDVASSDAESTVELVFGAPRRVTGRVLDAATSAPISRADVVWVPSDGPRGRLPPELAVPGQTDSLGRFELELPSLSPDSPDDEALGGTLHARAARHAAATAPVADQVELRLAEASEISGVVVDEAGAPVASAEVRAKPEEELPRTTDAEGRFTLKVSPHSATVHALAPDGRQALSELSLEPGERRELRLIVGDGATLEGVVVDQRGAPRPAMEVRVLSGPFELELARLTASAEGTFAALRMPAGTYSVAASDASGSTGRASGVEHPSGGPVKVTVAAGASLEGWVRTAQGQRAANATVRLAFRSGEPPRLAYADEAGHFAFDELRPTSVTVSASVGEVAAASKRLLLAPGERSAVELTLRLLGKVQGHVAVESPHRVTLRLAAFEAEDNVRRREGRLVETDEHGDFTLELPAGAYGLDVGFGPDAQRTIITVNGGETTRVDLTLEDVQGEASMDDAIYSQVGTGLSFDTSPAGVAVDFLMAGSPAARAGLRQGDLVVAIDGAPIRDSLEAFERVRRDRGDEVRLTIRRAGAEQTVVLK
jgi:hypothetical protein